MDSWLRRWPGRQARRGNLKRWQSDLCGAAELGPFGRPDHDRRIRISAAPFRIFLPVFICSADRGSPHPAFAPAGRRPPVPGLGSPLEHIYMSFRLATYRPVSGSCRNRDRRLRRDHGGDILAGVPAPCALQIELTRDDKIPDIRCTCQLTIGPLKNADC